MSTDHKVSEIVGPLYHATPYEQWLETGEQEGLFVRLGTLMLVAPAVTIKPRGDEIKHIDIYEQAVRSLRTEVDREFDRQDGTAPQLDEGPKGVEDAGYYSFDLELGAKYHRLRELVIENRDSDWGRASDLARQTTLERVQGIVGANGRARDLRTAAVRRGLRSLLSA